MSGWMILESPFRSNLVMLALMSRAIPKPRGRTPQWRLLISARVWVCIGAALTFQALTAAPLEVATNLVQIRQLGLKDPGISHAIRVDGQVCWTDPSQKTLALIDGTGGLILGLDWLNQPVEIGQHVRLTGAAAVTRAGHSFRIGINGLVLENDGLHPTNEQSATVFLKAGHVPIRVQWFNGTGPFALTVEYEGPDLHRQRIDASALFTDAKATTRRTGAVDYASYEGSWTRLPDFDRLKPVKSGMVDNFNLEVRTRDEGVGLQFAGWLRVPATGPYRFFLNSDDGSRLFIGETNMQMEIVSQGELPAPRQLFVGQLLNESEDGSWSQVTGKVTKISPGGHGVSLELSVGLARMQVSVPDATNDPTLIQINSLIRATGFCQGTFGSDGLKVPDLLLVPDRRWLEIITPQSPTPVPGNASAPQAVLTTSSQVHQLKREAAELGFTARVRGVVTSTDLAYHGFTLQDAERGLYVQDAIYAPQVGDFVEVEGVTDPGFFAPMLKLRQLICIGQGRLPEPIRPSWDQLMNGSLDAQYVEIEGVVIGATPSNVQLLTPGGSITAELVYGLKPEEMHIYENNLVRIRGGLIAVRNETTHQVRFGQIRICNPEVIGEEPGPVDVFAVPEKTPAELLQFDPKASLFQRVRMSGQIIHVADDVCFMMAGGSGVRFMPSTSETMRIGDKVEVAGYPQLGGASPLLRAAVIRTTGHALLPDARYLQAGDLPCGDGDATRVRVEGTLTDMRGEGQEAELEMQTGKQRFVARVLDKTGSLELPIGSRLELTGVYAVLGGDQAVNRPISLYELLLNSPGDVKILARPPWWTLQRLLVMVGMLICVLVVAALWITQLHRKVEERTVQLEEQIQKRQRIEQHRAMEQERGRIAQDLHDELGSGLTEISMLSTISANGTDSSPHLDEIGDRARQMVMALDEIVWAMNPKHDFLESLGSYLCLYADRFLKLARIALLLKGTLELPDRKLNPVHRHEFFLAFKEALTNVVRHSGATEVQFNIRIIGRRLRLALTDNGGGLASTSRTSEMDGLANMRARIERIGGRFAIASKAGRGTILRFYLPLD
jgi:signal transduction histidine kinase